MTVSLALRALAVLPLGLCWLPEVSPSSRAALPGTLRWFSEKPKKNIKKKRTARRDDTVLSQTPSVITKIKLFPLAQPVLSAE